MVSIMEIYQLLPKLNCKECGKPTCMAFASSLLSCEAEIADCPPLYESEYEDQLQELQSLLAPVSGATETGLVIHEELCFGCGNCVVACPVNVANDPHGAAIGLAPSNDKVILEVAGGVVTAMNVGECRRFGKNKILCDVCIVTCPSKAIEFI